MKSLVGFHLGLVWQASACALSTLELSLDDERTLFACSDGTRHRQAGCIVVGAKPKQTKPSGMVATRYTKAELSLLLFIYKGGYSRNLHPIEISICAHSRCLAEFEPVVIIITR